MVKIIKRFRWYLLALIIVILWIMGFKSLTFIMPDERSQQVSDIDKISTEALATKDVLGQVNDNAQIQDDSDTENDSLRKENSETTRKDYSCQSDKRKEIDEWHQKTITEKQNEFERASQALTTEEAQRARENFQQNLDQISQQYTQKLNDIGC